MNILIGVIVGMLTTVPHSIMSLFLKSKNILIKYIGLFITVCILGLCFYLSVVSAAFMGLEKSNVWGM